MKKKWGKRAAAVCMTFGILAGCFDGWTVYGYFDRGPVEISVGKESTSLAEGESESISIQMTPWESSQLPGCGMAECPQICGEKDCLDENGECKCAGTEYSTYTASATAVSSNTSVAVAEMKGNSGVMICAVSAGEATITLTSSLRQFQSRTAEIQVTVREKPAPQPSEIPEPAPQPQEEQPEQQGPSGEEGDPEEPAEETGSTAEESVTEPETKAVPVGEQGTAAGTVANKKEEKPDPSLKQEESRETSGDVAMVKSGKGNIYFYLIKEQKMGKKELEAIQGKEEYADFQKKDEGGTILYSWEFFGKDVKKVFDFDMGLRVSDKPAEAEDFPEVGGKSVYLSFGHEGELPGKSSVTIRVADYVNGKEPLTLYLWNQEKQQPEKIEDNIKVENGYASISLEHCSRYLLTSQPMKAGGNTTTGFVLILGIGLLVCLLGGGGTLYLVRRKKAQEGGEENTDA